MQGNIDSSHMWESITNSDECRRLHHGRGGSAPTHVNIDWYPPHLIVTLYREDDVLLSELANSSFESIFVQHRYQDKSPWSVLKGDRIDHHIAIEDELKYHLTFFKDQNIGFFIDMKEGRRFVRESSKNRKVLNLFAYSCSFSVAAIAGGATEVTNIDVNSALLSRGRENHRLNGQTTGMVNFFKYDIMKSWGRISKKGPYDLIVIDPPTFQKGRFDVQKNYATVARRVPEMLSAHGTILACLNAPFLNKSFLKELFRDFDLIATFGAPLEFGEIDPDSGLKICAFRCSDS